MSCLFCHLTWKKGNFMKVFDEKKNMHAIARLIRNECSINRLPDNFYMVRAHSLGGVDFNYLPRRGGDSDKLKKGVEVWCWGRSS